MFRQSLPRLWLCIPMLAISLIAGGAAPQADTQATRPAASTRAAKVRIVLAGDSTVTDKQGWGAGFVKCLAGEVECFNLSRGGRSSKSFIAEGLWAKCLELKPDYILIQFGHNDQPGHPGDRETDPQTTYRQYMTQYVDDARAAGAKPVLITSLSRRQWGDDGKIHSTLQPYVDVVKEIAAAKQVPLIDLHARSIELYEKLGREGCNALSPAKSETDETIDNTHLNAKGGDVVGPIVAEKLAKAVPDLAPYINLKGAETQPTKAEVQTQPQTQPQTQAVAKTITVAADGSGDYKTIHEAIAAVPTDSPDRTVIHIKPGTYDEGQIILPDGKSKVTFEGEDAATTILTYALNVNDPVPPEQPAKFKGNGVVILANDFRAEKITFQNTSGDHGQAMALRVDGDRAAFYHCRLLGWQDTLLLHGGRQYFQDCYLEGRVDFIYGAATAVFDRCEIHSKNGGYVTAASTPQDHPFGLVFLNCTLTGEGKPAYLGRPWRPFASVTYINCQMGDHIRPEGWDNWRNPDNEKTARYAEYNSTGPGANPANRVAWSKQLSKEEADKIMIRAVLGGKDGWNPAE